MFDAPHALESRQALSPESLRSSLQITLNAYPQWAGQLQLTGFDEEAGKIDHTKRGFGRLKIKHGSLDEDPGVELVISHCDADLASIVPISSERNSGQGIWDPTVLDSIGLLPDTPALALEDMETSKGLPSVIIQLTSFRCEGVAISLKIRHPLADAQSLLRFMMDWARTNAHLSHLLSSGSARVDVEAVNLPRLAPLFNPEALDGAAAGNIDLEYPVDKIIAQATQLDLHRFDYWASGTEDCPSFMKAATVIALPLAEKYRLNKPDLGKPIPWDEWDMSAKCTHRLVYFSRSELENMQIFASTESTISPTPSAPRISKLDALLAHIWSIIIECRNLPTFDETTLSLHLSLGLRPRLDPPLPPSSLGSPTFLFPVD